MSLITAGSLLKMTPNSQIPMDCTSNFRTIPCPHVCSFRFRPNDPLSCMPRKLCIVTNGAKKNKNPPVVKTEAFLDEDDDEDEFDENELLLEDEELLDDDDEFFDDLEEEAEVYVGDGSGGGGISLAGTSWDKTALELAEEVALSFDGELGIFAFKTLKNANIQVVIERLTNKSGSPDMMDIEAFTSRYREKLDEAEVAGSIPDNIYLEVSSPGSERVVRIPQDLERFKDRPMYVKYVTEVADDGSSSEHDGVLRLVSFDLETNDCVWGIADVRVNREKEGKGRPLSKKKKEWRLETPFTSLRLVRLHSDF